MRPVREVESVAGELRSVIAEIQNLTRTLAESPGNVQTVVHKTEGSSVPLSIAVSCVILIIGFIVIENRSFAAVNRELSETKKELQDELRDVKAWNEVLRGKVAKLEAIPQEKKT